jgi:17beta-estradiol 17-dehydrogenase/3beta-hydroxysteroid 3-dehydrogenase
MESERVAHGKVALITGGNAGIGLALAARLLQKHSNLHVCIGCRNEARAEAARSALLASSATASVSVLLIDVASPRSVYRAASEVRRRYDHIDYLYLNAGIMPGTTVNWKNFWKQLFSARCIDMFTTGDGLLQQEDGLTSDGLKEIFATNLFGHFILIKELEPIMGGPYRPTQVIWTSSNNAKKEAFQLADIQHVKGTEPYSASKYASDLVSYAINEQLNNRGIYSHTTNPGLVLTNLTYGILPSWFWLLFLPILWLLRLFTTFITISPYNGSEALVWLSEQRPETLDPFDKYFSNVSVAGWPYVSAVKMNISADEAIEAYNKLSQLEAKFRSTCKE